jgi:hypothetical protein
VKAPQAKTRGYDAGKKITGRKHHIAVDTDGRLLLVNLTPADISDSAGAQAILEANRQWRGAEGDSPAFGRWGAFRAGANGGIGFRRMGGDLWPSYSPSARGVRRLGRGVPVGASGGRAPRFSVPVGSYVHGKPFTNTRFTSSVVQVVLLSSSP